VGVHHRAISTLIAELVVIALALMASVYLASTYPRPPRDVALAVRASINAGAGVCSVHITLTNVGSATLSSVTILVEKPSGVAATVVSKRGFLSSASVSDQGAWLKIDVAKLGAEPGAEVTGVVDVSSQSQPQQCPWARGKSYLVVAVATSTSGSQSAASAVAVTP